MTAGNFLGGLTDPRAEILSSIEKKCKKYAGRIKKYEFFKFLRNYAALRKICIQNTEQGDGVESKNLHFGARERDR